MEFYPAQTIFTIYRCRQINKRVLKNLPSLQKNNPACWWYTQSRQAYFYVHGFWFHLIKYLECIVLSNVTKKSMLFGTWLGMIRITWGKSPEWFGRNPRLTKGHYRVYCQPMLPGETRGMKRVRVWLNATFYSTLSAIIGLAVETWRVKTELIIITILHIIIILYQS